MQKQKKVILIQVSCLQNRLKNMDYQGFKRKINCTNRVTDEIMYEPNELIEIDKSMLPIKFAGLIIEDFTM